MVQDMKIYIGHSSDIDFRSRLYDPVRGSELDDKHRIVFPHEDSDEPFDSRKFLREECDLFVAEVSEASTGLGIELGWADIHGVPIICIYREGENISGSIEEVADKVVSYSEPGEVPALILSQVKREK